jgi:hypothetical protein
MEERPRNGAGERAYREQVEGESIIWGNYHSRSAGVKDFLPINMSVFIDLHT